jgi:hypothetical protein
MVGAVVGRLSIGLNVVDVLVPGGGAHSGISWFLVRRQTQPVPAGGSLKRTRGQHLLTLCISGIFMIILK